MKQPTLRIGIGYDCHPLVTGRKLTLGGIVIPFDKGLYGWSDADVLVHAIIDSLCGAGNLGDKGILFPDNNPEYRGISSLILLKRVSDLIMEKGFEIINIDSIVNMKQPKILPYVSKMRTTISNTLGIDSSQISIKASSSNELGFEGKGEGISSHAIVLLQIKPSPG